jgi:hypothetical protein
MWAFAARHIRPDQHSALLSDHSGQPVLAFAFLSVILNDATSVLLDKKTSIILGAGKVTAFDGTIAKWSG